MLTNIGEKVGIAVATTLVLGFLAFIWQAVSDGGLVRLLGGVTKSDISGIQSVPASAVVAFDSDECPEGWVRFAEAHSRVIIGATEGSEFLMEYNPDGNLSRRNRGIIGGTEAVRLSTLEMAEHRHSIKPNMMISRAFGNNAFQVEGNKKGIDENNVSEWTFTRLTNLADTDHAVDLEGDGMAHENMPPFIALYFCKKD